MKKNNGLIFGFIDKDCVSNDSEFEDCLTVNEEIDFKKMVGEKMTISVSSGRVNIEVSGLEIDYPIERVKLSLEHDFS